MALARYERPRTQTTGTSRLRAVERTWRRRSNMRESSKCMPMTTRAKSPAARRRSASTMVRTTVAGQAPSTFDTRASIGVTSAMRIFCMGSGDFRFRGWAPTTTLVAAAMVRRG
jgi:hypothetical protein